MLGAASQCVKAKLLFLYLPQTHRHSPTREHRPLQAALGPPKPAIVPTCFTQTIGAQCSMLLWSLCPPPPSLYPPELIQRSNERLRLNSGKEQVRFLAGWKSPKGFSVPSSLVKAKLTSAEGEIH